MPGTAPGPPGSAGGRRCTLVYAVCGPGHSRPASATAPGGGAGGRTRDVAVGRATESFSEKCSLVSRCSGRVPWVLYRAGGQVIFFSLCSGLPLHNLELAGSPLAPASTEGRSP